MDVRYAAYAVSCLTGFMAAFFLAKNISSFLQEYNRSSLLQQRVGSTSVFGFLQLGVPGTKWLAERTLAVPLVLHSAGLYVQALESRGIAATPQGVLSLLIAVIFTLLAFGFVFGRLLAMLVLAAALCALSHVCAIHVLEQRQEKLRDALPSALQSMSSCFGAGYTLLQTFEYLSREVAGPLRSVFQAALDQMYTGASPQKALMHIRKAASVSELSFVAVALAVQHQTGGSMQQVLDAAREALKEELALKRSLRVQTAQAKLSARVVVGVTVGLVIVMMLLSRDFLSPFFESASGIGLLLLALCMQLTGILAVRRFLKVEVY